MELLRKMLLWTMIQVQESPNTLCGWQEDPQAKSSRGEEVQTINVQDG
jgi:hypothetical protein